MEPIELTHVCSRADSDATEDDLPGPGRTLDNVYIAAGHHIEAICGRAARLLRRGRRSAAQNIRRTQEEADYALHGHVDLDSANLFPYSDADGLFLVCSRDTNATADDLPGPGRTLGKLYDLAGLPIELLVGKTAQKIGKGPRMAAQRIRRRRGKVEFATIWHYRDCWCRRCLTDHSLNGIMKSISVASVKRLTRKIDEDCKQLLKYVESNILSTQKQALDCILDLAIEHSDIRALLKSHGAPGIISGVAQVYLNFRSGDNDHLLLSSSRKALVSLGDAEINTLLAEFLYVCRLWSKGRNPNLLALWNNVSAYLHDPEFAFLVVRSIRKANLFGSIDENFGKSILLSIRDSPNHFEWEECEQLVNSVFSDNRWATWLSCISDWLLRYAQWMPRVLESRVVGEDSMKPTESNPHFFTHTHRTRNVIAESIVSATQADEQTLSLKRLKQLYTYPPLQPLLNDLVCPLDCVVRDFFVIDHEWRYDYFPRPLEKSLYEELVNYIDTSDFGLQTKAWDYINYFLALDVYRCRMMLDALSQTPFGTSEDFTSFKEIKRKACVPKEGVINNYWFRRHFDADNCAHYYREEYGIDCFCREIRNEEAMVYPSDWMLNLRVERGTTLSRDGLYPLAVGYATGAGDAYLAQVHFSQFDFDCAECYDYTSWIFTTVADGTKPEDLRVEGQCPHRKVLAIPDRLEVPLLRYAPDAYARVLGIDEEDLFTTGHFRWNPVKRRGTPRRGYQLRVIAADKDEENDKRYEYEQLWTEEETAFEWDFESHDEGRRDQDSGSGTNSDCSSRENVTELNEEAGHLSQMPCEDKYRAGPVTESQAKEVANGLDHENKNVVLDPGHCRCCICRRVATASASPVDAVESGPNRFSLDEGDDLEIHEKISSSPDVLCEDTCRPEPITKPPACDAAARTKSSCSLREPNGNERNDVETNELGRLAAEMNEDGQRKVDAQMDDGTKFADCKGKETEPDGEAKNEPNELRNNPDSATDTEKETKQIRLVQTSELCHGGKVANRWCLKITMMIVILDVLVVALGIVLDKST